MQLPFLNFQYINRRCVGNLPFRDHLIEVLVKEKFARPDAERIIDSIDEAVEESISRSSLKHLSVEEYENLFRTYQVNLETHRKELLQMDQTNQAAITSDNEFLLSEINRSRQRIKEESGQLEGNIQLDLNLERKRRTELSTEMETKVKVASEYVQTKSEEIQGALKELSRQATMAIGISGAILLTGFIFYKLHSL